MRITNESTWNYILGGATFLFVLIIVANRLNLSAINGSIEVYKPHVAKEVLYKSHYTQQVCPRTDSTWETDMDLSGCTETQPVYQLHALDHSTCQVTAEEYDKAQIGQKWFCQNATY